MASLKQIMNVDEDSPDPDSHKRAQHSASTSSRAFVSTTSGPASTSTSASALAPSYTPSYNYAFPPSSSSPAYTFNPQSTPAPSRHPHPFAPEVPGSSSSYSSSSAPASGRRVSSTSTESMDSYQQGPGYSQDYSQDYDEYSNPPGGGGGPSRGSGSGSGGDGSQRMTPVTKRPSKAMKGRPVHICELCRPPKAFTRAEHLRRHQPSHYPPTLTCNVPGCERVFWRQDLLVRHQQKHKQDGSLPDEDPHDRMGDPSYHDSGASYHSQPHRQVRPPHQDRSEPNHNTPWPPSQQHPHGGPPGPQNHSQPPPWANYHSTDVGWPTYPADVIPRSHEMPISLSHPYSNMTTSPQPNPMAFVGPIMPFPGYSEDHVLAPHNPSHTAVRSLPLTLAVGPSSESLVTIPQATSSGPVGGFFSSCRPRDERPDPLAVAALMMPTSLSGEARKTIPAYINVYWDKVHPTYPIIHRSTFDDEDRSRTPNSEVGEQKELRRCAMAAIATQFLEDKIHRIHGDELYAHAWYKATERKNSETWTLETMQTILLCEYYARFRGKKKTSHLPSSQFRLLYQNIASYNDIFAPISVRGHTTHSWQKWIYAESRRRLLAACFLLDVHSSRYFKQPPVSVQGLDYSSISRLHIPLTAGMNELWDAANFRTWSSLAKHGPKLRFLSTTLGQSLTADAIARVPSFDAAILLAGCVLQLRGMQGAPHTNKSRKSGPLLSPDVAHLASLFQGSGTSNAYLAFHHTPLHEVLSVSGDSWLFNEKIPQAQTFVQHQTTLKSWSTSKEANVAAFFAIRGIASHLNLCHETADDVHAALYSGRLVKWTDISDYWGLYVCTLICWAWGQGVMVPRADRRNEASKQAAIAWILAAAEVDLQDLGDWALRRQTQAIVCLVRDILDRGCPGGRNRMLSDAVSVLKKLSDRAAVGF